MAENESKPADVDALAAMANGADLNESDPYLEQQAEIEDPSDNAAVNVQVNVNIGVPGAGSPAALNPRTTIPATPQLSRAEAAKRLAANTSAAYANQLKKMLIPLMLIIGAMLVVIGVLCWFRSGPLTEGYWFNENFKYFALVCVPMGLILLVGAYWFNLEAKRRK
jgi:hypothetical protein